MVFERIVWELRGVPANELEDLGADRKPIMVSRSFGSGTSRLADLEEALCHYEMSAGQKLRNQRGLTRAVLKFIPTNGFRQDLPQYSKQAVIELTRPTATRMLLGIRQKTSGRHDEGAYALSEK